MRLYVKAQELIPGDIIRRAYTPNGLALQNVTVRKVVVTDNPGPWPWPLVSIDSDDFSFELNANEDIKITRK